MLLASTKEESRVNVKDLGRHLITPARAMPKRARPETTTKPKGKLVLVINLKRRLDARHPLQH